MLELDESQVVGATVRRRSVALTSRDPEWPGEAVVQRRAQCGTEEGIGAAVDTFIARSFSSGLAMRSSPRWNAAASAASAPWLYDRNAWW